LLSQRNAVDAAIHNLAGEWTNRGIWAEDGSRAAGARLSRETHLPKPAAYRIVRRAAVLAEMPKTAAALAVGKITVEHVDLLAPLRTRAQRRLDALVEMAIRAASNGNGGGRPRPLVTVVVGDHSFRRLCELSDGTVITPGELVPYVGDLDVNTILFDGPFHAIAASAEVLRSRSVAKRRVAKRRFNSGEQITRAEDTPRPPVQPPSRALPTCRSTRSAHPNHPRN
jgi:hypothetical protein